jgi:hypothetical protein
LRRGGTVEATAAEETPRNKRGKSGENVEPIVKV